MGDRDDREVGVNKQKLNEKRMGVTRFTKKTERTFYFYAMVAMFLFYILSRLLGE